MGKYHESVMTNEILEALKIRAPLNSQAQKKYIDATMGTGGHTLALLEGGAKVLGIEVDREARVEAAERLKKYGPNLKIVGGNFKDISQIATEYGFSKVDGVIFDLGTNNLQLTSPKRGFSFGSPEAALDMRLDPENQAVNARDLLNILREDQLSTLFARVLSSGESRFLAKKVVRERALKPFIRVRDFLEAVKDFRGKKGLNPATLPFLALRIAVNSELENLEEGLAKAYSILNLGGKLVVISFHSAEDAIVKNFAKKISRETDFIRPSEEEIRSNPRARSAKLRIIQKWQTDKKSNLEAEV